MSETFLKLTTTNNQNSEADFLAANYPNAFILLYFIARRARRISGLPDGLEIGMALIGDWENMGLSRQNYRTALKVLETNKFLEILETNRNRKNLTIKSTTKVTTKGTLVRILDDRIFDINPEEPNHSSNHLSNLCLTTAQPLPNHEQDRIREKKREKEKEASAQTAARLRTKDALSFDFQTWSFLGISDHDQAEWKTLYPHIDIEVETTRAANWLKSNPTKSNKKLWRRYLTGWFGRSNDSIENKKAYRSASGSPVTDRRTRNKDGTISKSRAEDLF